MTTQNKTAATETKKKTKGKKKKNTPLLALGALGVVFGDIGTSPLYVMRQCFKDLHQGSVDPSAVLGILSLIFWSLIIVVCIKYLAFITKADHDGQGGTLAMLALIHTKRPRRPTASPTFLILMVFFGSALLYGDGVITPSISVLSAIEGLKIASPNMQSWVVPISIAILVGLFLVQHHGTGIVGNFFGPIMSVWFVSIAALGISGIIQEPKVLAALNPAAMFHFLGQHGWQGIIVLGAVVLCITGTEALFADLSHFGRLPIQLGWYVLVLPALVLNYFGQGALMLTNSHESHSPFFALVPHVLLYPVVILATIATVIASQALISGTFTLTEQAIHMGFFPRLRVTHTSKKEEGQIYIAAINYILMIACVLIIVSFRSSERLGGAYGLAVVGTMIVTSFTFFFVLRDVWKWPKTGALALTAGFLFVDFSFLAGNAVKITQGAWVPLVIALIVFGIFWIWTACGAKYRKALDAWSMPTNQFVHEVKKWKERSAGTGVFLTTHPGSWPLVGKNLWLRENIRPEQLLLITVVQEEVPYVPEKDQVRVENLAPECYQITASFGFMRQPDVTDILKNLPADRLKINWNKLVVYLPEAGIKIEKVKWWKKWILLIYRFLHRNSLSTAEYFQVPTRDVIHVGVNLEI